MGLSASFTACTNPLWERGASALFAPAINPLGSKPGLEKGIPLNIEPDIAPVGQGTKITQLWHPGPAAL